MDVEKKSSDYLRENPDVDELQIPDKLLWPSLTQSVRRRRRARAESHSKRDHPDPDIILQPSPTLASRMDSFCSKGLARGVRPGRRTYPKLLPPIIPRTNTTPISRFKQTISMEIDNGDNTEDTEEEDVTKDTAFQQAQAEARIEHAALVAGEPAKLGKSFVGDSFDVDIDDNSDSIGDGSMFNVVVPQLKASNIRCDVCGIECAKPRVGWYLVVGICEACNKAKDDCVTYCFDL